MDNDTKFVNLNVNQQKYLRNFISNSYDEVKNFSKMIPLDTDPDIKRIFNELNDNISTNQLRLYRHEILHLYLFYPEDFNAVSSFELLYVSNFADPLCILEKYIEGIHNIVIDRYRNLVLYDSNFDNKELFENHYKLIYKHSINTQKVYFSWLKENNLIPTKEAKEKERDAINEWFENLGND